MKRRDTVVNALTYLQTWNRVRDVYPASTRQRVVDALLQGLLVILLLLIVRLILKGLLS